MKDRTLCIIILLCSFLLNRLFSDVVVLKNDSIYFGEIQSLDKEKLFFSTKNSTLTFARNDVSSMYFGITLQEYQMKYNSKRTEESKVQRSILTQFASILSSALAVEDETYEDNFVSSNNKFVNIFGGQKNNLQLVRNYYQLTPHIPAYTIKINMDEDTTNDYLRTFRMDSPFQIIEVKEKDKSFRWIYSKKINPSLNSSAMISINKINIQIILDEGNQKKVSIPQLVNRIKLEPFYEISNNAVFDDLRKIFFW